MKKILSEIRTSHYVLPERWVFKSVTSKSGFVWRRIYCLIIFKSTVLSTQIPMYRKLYRYVRGFISSVQCGCAFLKEAEYSVFLFFFSRADYRLWSTKRAACLHAALFVTKLLADEFSGLDVVPCETEYAE